MSVEQKRADLEKALAALDENEIEAVAGGLSEKGKKIMKGVAIGAGVVVGAGAIVGGGGYALHKYLKDKKEPDSQSSDTSGIYLDDPEIAGKKVGDSYFGGTIEEVAPRD